MRACPFVTPSAGIFGKRPLRRNPALVVRGRVHELSSRISGPRGPGQRRHGAAQDQTEPGSTSGLPFTIGVESAGPFTAYLRFRAQPPRQMQYFSVVSIAIASS